jgi:cytochrome oxidase Cu insertion factor (SCO1/SenC/PrrC family)
VKTVSIAILLCSLLAGSCVCLDLISLMGMQPLEEGTEAPQFSLPDIDGQQISLSGFTGQVTLLNFWSPT